MLDLDTDFGRYLNTTERAGLARVSLAVATLPGGTFELDALLEERSAFAAVVVQGLMLHELSVGPRAGLHLLGPGDMVSSDGPPAAIVTASRYRAGEALQVATLGSSFLIAARREPRLFIALQQSMQEQTDRLVTQLVICQLPRVADRVLGMLWLLAETFGRVTAAGTFLSLELTHEMLGALVGARRPTITLALGELTERGAVLHQHPGWLLLQTLAELTAQDGDGKLGGEVEGL